jgi:hypothetical protein
MADLYECIIWVISHKVTFYISMVSLLIARFSRKKLLISLMQCVYKLRMRQKQATNFYLHSIIQFASIIKHNFLYTVENESLKTIYIYFIF